VDLTLDLFTPLVGEPFVIRAADGQIDAELVEAAAAPDPAMPDAPRTPFKITFRGPAAPMLQQGIHEVSHHALGPAEIFLVPIARDAAGAEYEAVFG
jgi:hypothetical protein